MPIPTLGEGCPFIQVRSLPPNLSPSLPVQNSRTFYASAMDLQGQEQVIDDAIHFGK